MKKKVYALRHEHGPVKIGISVNPESRCKAIDACCPYNVRILTVIEADDAHAVEAALHDLYGDYHMSGEWFNLPSDCILFLMEAERLTAAEVRQIELPLGVGEKDPWIRSRRSAATAAA